MTQNIEKAYFKNVELKYEHYNKLFTTLPLDAVQKTGIWLPLLIEASKEGFEKHKSPKTILLDFMSSTNLDLQEREQLDFFFKIIQYVERQVVLIDALEDAAYSTIHHIEGPDTWQWAANLSQFHSMEAVGDILNNLGVRVVLTAHPTQFYPKTVLAIITDLAKAIRKNQTSEIQKLLEQLGRTSFFQKSKPSPYDEALFLISHLKQVFYPAVGELLDIVHEQALETNPENSELIRLGFWPGGDRDGNPYVTTDITRRVAAELKRTILSNYYRDIKQLTRRMSFDGVYDRLMVLRKRLQYILGRTPEKNGDVVPLTLDDLTHELKEIEGDLREDHAGLFVEKLVSFRRKVNCFGFHFASLDLRQDSPIIAQALHQIFKTQPELSPTGYDSMSQDEQIGALLTIEGQVDIAALEDPLYKDTLESVAAIDEIQKENGEAGCHRYVLSNCGSPLDMAHLVALFRLSGWGDAPLTVDVVPLFETIDDLDIASQIMKTMYSSPAYRRHLKQRGNRQTVMFGFSDGTKDGGYLMANWAIYRAKEALTKLSREQGIEVYFFDGRGGPPARGGGETHLFYTALGKEVENHQIQVTLQGQTISTLYGTHEAANHNLELLLTAQLKSRLATKQELGLHPDQGEFLDELAQLSYQAYLKFRQHPMFVPYLRERSPLEYYGKTNIASRPTSRQTNGNFKFEDLRAIPFVGAWSQLKQNVPGFYGLGSALKVMVDRGEAGRLRMLYAQVDLFKAIVTNSMQSMSKSNFDLTRYLQEDEKFGGFWKLIHDEFMLTKEMVLLISGQEQMLEDSPRSRQSIGLRERVVLPLVTIQQYALIRVQELRQSDAQSPLLPIYEKLIIRSLFGNINAMRNSA